MHDRYLQAFNDRISPRLLVVSGVDPCWEWQGGTTSKGYGTISIQCKTHYVHRVVYLLLAGAIEAGMYVCHTCDNRICCNPGHLFLGTALDNHMDMRAKNRAWVFGKPPGELR